MTQILEKKTSCYIDLHLHLDGAITVEIAKKLAKLQNIALPVTDDVALEELLSVPASCENLNDFLQCFALPLSLLQTKEGISEAVYLVLENIRMQNVIYAEIRFAPQLHTQNGMTQEDVILAALEGLHRSVLPANLILCCMRGAENQQENIETVHIAKKYLVMHDGVVGLDLAGAEALFPTQNYQSLFSLAKKANIPFTIHAGEADGAESIRCAVAMGAKRIGHGVRLFEDPILLEEIRQKGIFLEMCPTSNRQTKAIADMTKYPLRSYLQQGLRVTLNTDDMAISRITLADEYRYMETEFGLTKEEKKQLLYNAIDAAFTNEQTKNMLRKTLAHIEP